MTDSRAQLSWVLVVLFILAVSLAACQPAVNDPETPDGEETSEAKPSSGKRWGPGPEEVQPRTVHVPDSGVHLGWGWDSQKEHPRPTVCIEFEMARDEGQTKQMTFREVSDTYEVMTSMGMSAAASVKSIGYKASGKAEFAKNAKTSGFSSNFVMNVAIDNGVVFAAPVPEGSEPGEVNYLDPEKPVAHHGAVRLTSEALSLARRSEPAFRERCGDSFVAALYGGAELTALITILTTTHEEQEKVSAELSGSGWGAEVKAGFSKESGTTASSFDSQMSFFQVGGRGDAIPKHKDDLLSKLDELPRQAADAPATFRMTLVPYTTLVNWPSSFDLEVDATDQTAIASTWGAYRTLYDEIQEVLNEPSGYVYLVPATKEGEEDSWVEVGNDGSESPIEGAVAALENLQDEVHETLREIRNVAVRCADPEGTCEFDPGAMLDPYGVRVRLPLPKAEKERTVEHLVDFHVRDTAQRRCDISPINPGCLSNAEVDEWVRRATREVVRLESAETASELRDRRGEGEDWYEVLPNSRHVYVDPWRKEDLRRLLEEIAGDSSGGGASG